jgi:hypothetical protein
MSSFMQNNITLAYPYTNQCILIARILTDTSMALKKYYTKTQIILRRQSYSKNVSWRAVGAVASRRVARASGIEEGNRGSGIVVVLARGSDVGAAGGRGVEEAEPSRAGRWPAVSGVG